MTTEERTELFKIYLQKFVQREQTVSGYISSLNNDFPIKLNMNNLFTNTNLIELKNISDNCNNDLEDWSKSIGNHRPRAAINKYISFLQYQDILKVLDKYDINPEIFKINDAYRFFKIKDRNVEYPIKAICRELYKELDLAENFTTNEAMSKLKQIIPKDDLDSVDNREIKSISNNMNLNILDKIIASLTGKEGEILTRKEILSLVINNYPTTNETSII
jgi:hypothetical protein